MASDMKRVMIFAILFATAGAVAVFISKSRWKDQTHYVLTSPKNHLAKSSNFLSVTSNGIDGGSAASSSISAAPSRAMLRPRARFADLPRTDSEIFVSSGDVLAEARIDRDADAARRASDLNQVMDALLDQPEIPADYGRTMVSIFRDRSRGVLERSFAVQHIGLYAAALKRRGVYDPSESSSLRAALWDASCERDSGVGAAALRALADIEEFDPNVDAGRLNSILVECAVDQGSAPAVRIMAVQLCGERTVRAVRPALESILSDGAAPETLRRSAQYALSRIDGKEISQ